MRKIIPILFVFAICSFAFSFPEKCDTLVKQVAEDNLAISLAKIPVGQENNFGFANREEFKLGKIGNPFRTITFTNDFYQDSKLTDKNYILLQNEWRVPVSVNGNNRILLTVYGKDSTLNVVDIGGMVLSKELQEKTPISESNNNYILRVYPLGMDFIVTTNSNQSLAEGTYIPMQSAESFITALSGKTTFTQSEILKLVKEKLAEQSKN
ncbi:MAG: hypothetical protein NT084_09615 [Bacteroidetes bacterium]|nr:hypothetical protein [Bacteroidota bacterium]